jgi:branched-chain amino acid transport system permease protein
MTMKHLPFALGLVAFLALCGGTVHVFDNEYLYYALFTILQLTAVSVAWNIMGGFCGYINFGTAGFLALGAYVAFIAGRYFGAPLSIQIAAAAGASGLLGFLMGYMTLRLKGIFFAIGTLSIAVILETIVNNLEIVGAARGMIVIRPPVLDVFSSYTKYLFFVMAVIVSIAIALSRYIQISWIGRGLRAIRDNEEAAEGLGVPTMTLKLIAASASGALMGAAGAPVPILMSFIEPTSLFSMNYSILAMAMPLVGGTFHWIGPVIGGVVLGVLQQLVSVLISSEINVLLTGLVLILSVVLAPKGILGLLRQRRRREVTPTPQHTAQDAP